MPRPATATASPCTTPGAVGGGAATLKNLTDLVAADAGDKAYDPNDKNASPYDKDEGDPVYSEAFLHEIGDTIREWETDNDDAYDGVMKNWQGTQEDPVKSLMNAMSRNPSASTHYFDPNTTDNLTYFLEDRKWPGGEVEFKMPEETQRTSARTDFGAALEAAATGREPGSPLHGVAAHHDGAHAAIFERIAKEYTGEQTYGTQSSVPLAMRTSMGNMIGDYASDVHQILGKNMDGPTDFNNLTIERGDLTRLMRGIAEDPKAFGVMHHSQSVVIAEGLNGFPPDSYRKEDPEMRAWVKQSASPRRRARRRHLRPRPGGEGHQRLEPEDGLPRHRRTPDGHPHRRRRAPAHGRRRHRRVHERAQRQGRRGNS